MAIDVNVLRIIIGDLVAYLNNDVYLGTLDGTDEVLCFDCELWNNGYTDSADSSVVIPPLKDTLLEKIQDAIDFLTDVMAEEKIADYGFKTQIQRLVDMLKDLKSKINAIQCEGPCPDVNLLAQLQVTIVMTITQLVSAFEMLQGLLVFIGTCGCIGDKFFELLIGRFINTITIIQCIVTDWSQIVMTFFQFQTMAAKSYVAAYVPKAPMPQPVMQQGMGFACVPCPPKPIPQNCPPCNCNNACTGFNPYC